MALTSLTVHVKTHELPDEEMILKLREKDAAFLPWGSWFVGNLEARSRLREALVAKRRKVPMRHINIGDLSRGQASRLIKEGAEKDEPTYVLRYGKPIAVVISNERYKRLMSEGIDPSDH
ncbi:hypothetical protein [Trueperella pyogenes]|uniref:hypothetical protein n=1 Tax=Trueperella pyogenes TaxID=1661 RepID=UPI0023DDDD3F|nr:hypothetical protein [Trueperella pyogenes]